MRLIELCDISEDRMEKDCVATTRMNADDSSRKPIIMSTKTSTEEASPSDVSSFDCNFEEDLRSVSLRSVWQASRQL